MANTLDTVLHLLSIFKMAAVHYFGFLELKFLTAMLMSQFLIFF